MTVDTEKVMQRFDAIYCINLDRRTDRWEQASEEFKKAGINHVHRWSAVDGTFLATPMAWAGVM
jgi:GR25 family glycosyltransferase involved in LPS biosynthesis